MARRGREVRSVRQEDVLQVAQKRSTCKCARKFACRPFRFPDNRHTLWARDAAGGR